VTEVPGDPRLELPGLFTTIDAETRASVVRAEGTFATTPDFQATKAQYGLASKPRCRCEAVSRVVAEIVRFWLVRLPWTYASLGRASCHA
jgi:hypothetical protein